MEQHSIFICYRRQDSADVAGRLFDRLVQQFGRECVFKDVDSIPIGVDFRKHLDKSVASCTAFLAVIGRSWLDAKDVRGKRALDDPRDFVRIEIESALRREVSLVPILIHGTLLPEESDLPTSIQPLVFRQGIPVRSDPDFHRDVQRLIDQLEETFKHEQALKQEVVRKHEEEALKQEVVRKQDEEARKQAEARKQEVVRKQEEESRKQAEALKQAEVRKQEEIQKAAALDGWRLACQLHTYQAYEAHVLAFPNGKYHDVAVERYRQLKPFWQKDRFGQ